MKGDLRIEEEMGKDSSSEEPSELSAKREVVNDIINIAIKHANTEICDKMEFLLQRLNSKYDYAFSDEIERLSLSSDRANRSNLAPRVQNKNCNIYESKSTHNDYSKHIELSEE